MIREDNYSHVYQKIGIQMLSTSIYYSGLYAKRSIFQLVYTHGPIS